MKTQNLVSFSKHKLAAGLTAICAQILTLIVLLLALTSVAQADCYSNKGCGKRGQKTCKIWQCVPACSKDDHTIKHLAQCVAEPSVFIFKDTDYSKHTNFYSIDTGVLNRQTLETNGSWSTGAYFKTTTFGCNLKTDPLCLGTNILLPKKSMEDDGVGSAFSHSWSPHRSRTILCNIPDYGRSQCVSLGIDRPDLGVFGVHFEKIGVRTGSYTSGWEWLPFAVTKQTKKGWCKTTAEAGNILSHSYAKLAWQADGNLVLYTTKDGKSRWASDTSNKGQKLCFQNDGNLVIYGNSGAVWATQTADNQQRGYGGLTLKLNKGCNIAVHNKYGQIWSAGNARLCLPWPESEGSQYAPYSGTSISLQSVAHNKYVVAEDNDKMNANRNSIGSWEKFKMFKNSDGTYSFRSSHNKYVSAKSNGDLLADRDSIQIWEKFFRIKNDDKTVSFESVAYGKYMSAQQNGDLDVDRTAIGSWEKFKVITDL